MVELDEKSLVTIYGNCLSKLWKIHPFREGNTRTIITFFELMIEDNYIYIDSDLLKDNANYVRTSLVAANAVFYDIGDKRNCEYLENIISHAFGNGRKLKKEIICNMIEANVEVTDEIIQEVIFESRRQNHILQGDEIVCHLLNK